MELKTPQLVRSPKTDLFANKAAEYEAHLRAYRSAASRPSWASVIAVDVSRAMLEQLVGKPELKGKVERRTATSLPGIS